MGIFTPKFNSALRLNSQKLNFLQTIVVVFLFLGITAFSVSEKNHSNSSLLETVAARTVMNTQSCHSNLDYAFWLDLNGLSRSFRATNGTFTEFDDGTAVLEMQVVNVDNSNLRFDVSMNYSGRTFSTPANSPKENSCSTMNTNDWYYYTSNSGTAIGSNGYEGALLSFVGNGPTMQLGHGANVTDPSGSFGGSGWLQVTVESQPNNNHLDFNVSNGLRKGDVNINLSGDPLSSCLNVTDGGEIAAPNPVCFGLNDPGLITSISLPSGGSGDIEYIWLKSTIDCEQSNATVISGANEANYNPGPIDQTTWFRRCARRAGCTSFDFGESNCVRIDFNESCGEPAPTGWTLNCEDDQSVEIIGEGIRCQNSYNINIPNANDVVQIVAEVVYKGQSANPSQLTIKTDNETAIVPAEFTNPARAFYFRTTFGPASQITLEHIPNACQAQSLILYVFREGGQTTASTGQFVQTWIYHDTHCETLEIPTAPATRDVEIEVPLSEITTDGRIAIVRAEVVDNPSINAEVIINDVNQGDALYIAKLVLEGVAPLEDEIEICVESPFETATTPNGQSLVYSGAVKANPECKTCDDSDIALSSEIISDYNGSRISCNGAADGRLQALISGGVPPFTYTWSNGETGQIVSDIAPGTYEVTVSDRFGCTATAASVTIDEPQPVTAIIEFTSDYNGSPISCSGANDASIRVIASGGTAPYIYQWGASGNFSNAEALNNLAPGTYEVQVADANGCIVNANISVEEPAEFTAEEIDVVANYNGAFISCSGAEDGILSINASGGTVPYIYNWSNGGTTATIENLGPGSYTVTVEDANGCSFVRTVSIDEPNPLTLDLTVTTDFNGFNISCFGQNDAAITAFASGGTGTLTYTWSNGSSSVNIDELTAGTYTLLVVDENGCSIEKSITVTEPTDLEIEALVISDYNGASISCTGANDARAQVIITGALAPYTINWSNGENTQIIADLAPGNYTVEVIDANGCQKSTSLQIDEPEALTCNANINSNYFEGVTISSQGGSDGAASITVAGGTGNITYQWSNGGTTESIENLSAGTYEVVVADENGCNCSASVTLEDPAKVGDQVWLDLNGNGVYDAGETGFPNVELILTGIASNGTVITRNVTTDDNGNYSFDGLLPGEYKITLNLPADFDLSALNVGGNDAIDSDFDPSNFMTELFSLNPGDNIDDIDAGLYQTGKIGDYVWIDINKNGTQDVDESPLSGVMVTLTGTNGLGQVVNLTMTTDANGFYLFDNLLPGNYKLTFEYPLTPIGLEVTIPNIGDSASDSDIDPATGMTEVITLNSGDDIFDIDAGFIDATDPVLVGVPVDTTVSCADVPDVPALYTEIFAEDNLDQDVVIVFTETSTQVAGNDCGAYDYEIIRTWEATDDSGNSLVVIQTITVVDNIAPSITGVPADITIDCAEVPAPVDPEVLDDCDDEANLVFSEIRIDGTCLNEYTLVRTWTATDACGNNEVQEQRIVVQDNSLPQLNNVPADITVSCDQIPAVVNVTAEDNCTIDLDVVYGEVVEQGSCANDYVIVRTWTVADECGNQEVGTQRIKVEDNEDPELTGVPADLDLSCEDFQGYQIPVVSAGDDCTDNIVVDFVQETISQTCDNTFTLKLTWTATDECGNSTSESQIINVIDDSDPTLIGVPGDVVLTCQEYANYVTPNVTAEDNCTAGIQVEFLEEVLSQTCENTFELKLTWTATDACGNSTSESQLITVTDEETPVLNGVPSDVNISCEQYAGYDPDVVTATDNCTDNIQVEFLEEVLSQTCENTFELKLTWTATDACGNSTSESQLITVTDEEAPVLNGVPSDVNISCEQYTGYNPNVVTATDNCTDNIQVEFLEELLSQTCENTFELKLTWTATDACGNSTSESQLITVSDEEAPILNGVPSDVTLSCDQYTGYDADVVTVTDNCTDAIQVVFLEEVLSQECENTFELKLTWTATDACGNSTSESQLITVKDDQRPQLFGVPADVTVSCEDYTGYDSNVVTATDNCTDNIQVAFLEETLESTCVNGFVLRLTWTATDACGNTSTNNQEITVVDDIAPEIFGVPADLEVDCNNVPDAPIVGTDITAADNCTANIAVDYLETVIEGGCSNEYLINRVWTATDECGNQTVEQQKIFVSDVQDPILIGVPTDVNVSCGALPVVVPNVEAEDNCTANIQVDFLENIIPGACEFSYTIVRTWTATDECGNTTSEEQRIEVGDDLDPSLESAPADVTVDCNNIPSAVTLMASDDCGGTFEADFLEIIQPGSCTFNYVIIRTWTATDACGNQATESQEITVSDNIAPVISGVPADEFYTCGSDDNITLPTVTITDNCDQNAILEFNEEVIPGNCPNTYTLKRTWTAIDACGNTNTEHQNIEVTDDVDPVLSGVPSDMSTFCGQVPAPANVTATDGCQDIVTVQFLETNEPGSCIGNYTITRTWTATDDCGNQSSESQIIEVVDNEAPVLSPMPTDLTVDLGVGEQVPAAESVVAIDECDTNPGLDFEESEEPLGNCGNLIIRTWRTRDACGNVASHTQTITVLSQLSASLTPSQANICAGEETEFNVIAQGSGYTYTWDVTGGTVVPNNASAIFSSQSAGTYIIQVVVSDDNGCQAILKSQIVVEDPANGSANANSPLCYNETIELTAEGGTAYEWTGPNGFTSSEQNPIIPNATIADAGDYIVNISNGTCTSTLTVNVIVGEQLTADFSIFPQECGVLGSISVGAFGGTGTITFDWADLPGSNNPAERDDLVPGSYDVIVSDEIGCTIEIQDLEIIDACQCDAFAGTLDQANDNACLDQGAAIITAIANGDAVIPAGFETIFVLTSGSDLTIVDVKDVPSFEISVEGNYTIHTLVYDPSTLDLSIVQIGQTTGFDVYNLLTQGAGTICGNLDVTGASFVVTSPSIDVLSTADENCGNEDGLASLSPATYDFDWSDGGTGAIRNDLKEGTYTVQGTSPEGCTTSVTVSIGGSCTCTEPLISDIVVFEAHCGFLDGSAEVIPVGNPANFSYAWSTINGTPNGIGNKRSGLAPGIYEVEVSNNNFTDCKTVVSVVVGTIGGPIVEDLLVTDANCEAADGSVSFLPTSNTYVWEFDNFTGNSRSDLAPGKYYVVVLDGNVPPCADIIEVEVGSSVPLTLSAETLVAPDCDVENGEVKINVENGSGNYSFLWDGLFAQSESTRDELSQGLHTVLVTDNDNGCEKELIFVLNNDVSGAELSLQNLENESCVGLNNGSVAFTYNLEPNFVSPATTLVINRTGDLVDEDSLAPGDYFMLVEDANGCVAGNLAFAINEATALKINIGVLDETCDQESQIDVEITGGTADYTFDWADISGADNVQDRFDIEEGIYELIISDAAGCDLRIDQIQVNNACLTSNCDEPVVSNIVVIESNCGLATGAIQIEMVGSNTDYVYNLIPNLGNANENVFANLPAGAYEIVIEDKNDNQCSISQIVVVENADGPQANLIQSAPAQCGMNNGTAVMSPFNLIYEWCNGVTDFNPSNLPAGNCFVTITDPATGCSNVQAIEILEQNNLEANAQVINAPDCGSNNGEVIINVLGGSSNYTYLWEDGTTSQLRSDLSDGSYSVEITDQTTGCSFTYSFGLVGEVEGDIQILVNDILPLNTNCAGDSNIEIDFSLVPSASFEGPAQVTIEDINGNEINNGTLSAGDYTLLVSDVNGCLANTLAFEVVDAEELKLDVAITAASCDDGGSILVVTTGGEPSYIYNWADLTGNDNIRDRTGLTVGSYSLTVTDVNGCIVEVQNIEIADDCVDCGQPDFTAIELELNSDDQYCFDLESCFDPNQVSFVLGDGMMNGSSSFANWQLDAAGCLTYSAQGVAGMNVDQICIIAFDGTNSDTTCISFSIIEAPMSNPMLDTIYVSTDIDVTLDSCLNIDDIGGVVTGSTTNSNADNGVFFITSGECYRYIPNPGETGMFIDTVTVILCNNNIPACDTTVIVLSILPDQSNCDPFYTGPTDLVAEDCQEGAPVCLDFEIGDLFDYQITDNGAAYDGAFDVCVIDTQYQYVAFQLGAPGAYTLDEWQANGQTYTLGLFTSTQQLADSMNVWDPTGNWEVFGFVIVGGNGGSDYGSLFISANSVPQFEVPNQIIPDATIIYLSEGNHNLIVQNMVDGCVQEIDLDVTCVDPPVVVDTLISVQVGTVDTFCFDLSVVNSIVNDCLDENDGNTGISLIPNSNCIAIDGLLLGSDQYCLTACDTITGICETVNIEIAVVPVTDTIYEIVNLGLTETLCLDTTIFQNAMDVFINDCSNPFNLSVDFNLDLETYCVDFTGDLIGQDTACLVICDSLGFCDTTVLIVNVLVPSLDTLTLPILVGTTDTICLDDSELSGPIQSIINICPESVGENADIIVDPTTNCIFYTGSTVGQDTACFVICDANQVCDTTTIFFDVFTNLIPVAINDDTTTTIGSPVVIEILLNDTINGSLEGFEIIGGPQNGTVIINPDGTVTYTPNPTFCGGTDSFMYSISNEFGTDVATVTIEVLCQELIIFSGFSPNNDNINDVFTILGIESFPNNQVCVFNRWGSQVHNEKGYTNDRGWRGTFDGKDLPDGTYFYVVEDGEGNTFSGYVQIHR